LKVFYHSADLDGHCSGAICKLKYPLAEMHKINYGDKFPWDKVAHKEEVFMVDFSLQPFEDMIKLNKLADFTWIDHHKTSIADYTASGITINGRTVEGKAGCELTWEYLFPDKEMPVIVHLLGRYDVWDHEDERVLPIQHRLKLGNTIPDTESTMNNWRRLFELYEDSGEFLEMLRDGKLLGKYIDKDNEMYARNGMFYTNLDGFIAIAVNRTIANSKLFSCFSDLHYDIMVAFGWRKGKWSVHLYTDKPYIDVSAIAKNYGGGGHRAAAGFQTGRLPFELR